MKTRPKRMLIILGGLYHDFDGFANAMQSLFEAHGGWSVETTFDLNVLTRLNASDFRMVVSYTCLSKNSAEQQASTPEKLTNEQVRGLADWVQDGGALLTIHCATVLGDSGPELQRLFGGAFISHPAPFTFTVYPVAGAHPITRDVAAFDVYDEFYIQHCEPTVAVHMLAIYDGASYPMVWSRFEGAGRVAHIAPGHFPEVWELAPYQRLLIQAADWLTDAQ